MRNMEVSMNAEGGMILFRTPHGDALVGDSTNVLASMEPESVDLVVTSPPFALLREKEYGNLDQTAYVEWLCGFAPLVKRVLKQTGSYVIDLGGAYRRGVPVRSLYNYRVLLNHVDKQGFFLAEEFFWHNPSKLPSPIEWVNKRKLRAKDSVNTVWWLSKTEWPKADVSKVLAPYSERMKTLLKDADKFYKPKVRPSGHDISAGFAKDNGGAIPPNLLQFPNSESNGNYLRLCKEYEIKPHPARFPRQLPEFFVRLLTDPGDFVMDIFGGSGTTAEVAETLGRRWRTVDVSREYVRSSSFRFMAEWGKSEVDALLQKIDAGLSPTIGFMLSNDSTQAWKKCIG
jgi:site-specific DNA-methyltransferase (cytosine-N4-specific)